MSKVKSWMPHWSVDSVGEAISGVYNNAKFPELYGKLWSFVPEKGEAPSLGEMSSHFSVAELEELDALYEADYGQLA